MRSVLNHPTFRSLKWPICLYPNLQIHSCPCSSTWTESLGPPPLPTCKKMFSSIQFIFSVMGAKFRSPRQLQVCQPFSRRSAFRSHGCAAHRRRDSRNNRDRRAEHLVQWLPDGRASPAVGGYTYGGGTYSIAQLNENLQHRNVGVWPRIDLIPGCPRA